MDYIWAPTFILGAVYFVLEKRSPAAGIFVGIGVACRMTSAAMLLPLTVTLHERPSSEGSSSRHIATLWVTALVTGAVFYAPVFMKYGTGTFTLVESDVKFSAIAGLAGRGVWGNVGLGAIVAGACASPVLSLANRRARPSIPVSLPRRHLLAWLLAIAVYLAIFARLPAEAGYLTIVVPFVVLVLARWLKRPVFIAVCVLLAASSFVDVNRGGVFPSPILYDQHVRRVYMADSRTALRIADALPGDKLVIVGGWMAPQLQALRTTGGIPNDRKSAVFAFSIDVPQLRRHLADGYEVYIVPLRFVHKRPGEIPDLLKNGAKMMPENLE